MSWIIPTPRWDTLAGRVLDAFFAAVSEEMPDYDLPLTIFSSTPIQLCLDEAFASANVDIIVLEHGEALRDIAAQAGVGRAGKPRAPFGVQICPPQLFKPTPHYLQRAHFETRHGLEIVVPHLRDILIAKLHRSRTEDQMGMASKDRRAFFRVREMSHGHPSKEEFLEDLVSCESHFRPTLDGSINSFLLNVEDALTEIYGHSFDLQRDILAASAQASQPPISPPPGTVSSMVEKLRPDLP